jgi:hypothetical protein
MIEKKDLHSSFFSGLNIFFIAYIAGITAYIFVKHQEVNLIQSQLEFYQNKIQIIEHEINKIERIQNVQNDVIGNSSFYDGINLKKALVYGAYIGAGLFALGLLIYLSSDTNSGLETLNQNLTIHSTKIYDGLKDLNHNVHTLSQTTIASFETLGNQINSIRGHYNIDILRIISEILSETTHGQSDWPVSGLSSSEPKDPFEGI